MAKLVKCRSCEHQVAQTAKHCVQCSVKNPGITASDRLINCLSAVTFIVAGMLLYKISLDKEIITISEVEAAGFEKQYQRGPLMSEAMDGWAGEWNEERIELYLFTDRTAVDLEFFSKQAAPGNVFGWTDACIHKNLILLSDGKSACQNLKQL